MIIYYEPIIGCELCVGRVHLGRMVERHTEGANVSSIKRTVGFYGAVRLFGRWFRRYQTIRFHEEEC